MGIRVGLPFYVHTLFFFAIITYPIMKEKLTLKRERFIMFKIFKAKPLYWNVIYRDSKLIIRSAIVRADDEIELMSNVKRIFKHAEVLDFMRA